MTHRLKLSSLAILMSAGAVLAQDQTNLVQTMSIQLAAFKQGRTVTNGVVVNTRVDVVRVNTRDVIAALGASTGHTFSRDARLVVVTPVLGGDVAMQVRDGGAPVDVTWFFVSQQLSGSVQESQSNSRTGRSSSSAFSIQRFALVDGYGHPALGLHFDVNGIAVDSSVSSPQRGDSSELDADVSGMGDRDGDLLILRGSISVRGNTLEVVSGGGGDPV